jgi:apolipoprotein N-acyltransferase
MRRTIDFRRRLRRRGKVASPERIVHASRMQSRLLSLGFAPSVAVAASSSFILALGAPPNGWTLGHWLGWVPLLVIVRREIVSLRQAAWLGLAGGMGVGLGGFPWIAEMLVRFAGLPWALACIGLLIFSIWMAIPYVIWSVGLRAGPREGVASFAWAIVLFVSIQNLWPNLFPYTPLLGFAERPEWMQLAEVGGVHLVESIVIGAALFAARAVVARPGRAMARDFAIAVVIPSLLFGYGSWRMGVLVAEAEGAPTLRVGIVQPNLPVGGVPAGIKMARLTAPSARAERVGVDLIVWPEAGAYPYRIERPFRHDRDLGPRRVLVRHSTATIFGANTRAPGERFGWNTVYSLAADGEVLGEYDKVNLVPFGEVIPIIDPEWVSDLIPYIGHHERGEAPVRFVLPVETSPPRPERTFAAGPLICYEDIIPSFVREVAALPGGVDLFVNVTIDAWYGDSAEPWEHLALAQFRSIEHRIPMLRSVSTGVSAVVDNTGRVVAHIPLRPVAVDTLAEFPPEMLVERIALARNTERDPTPFARFGWLFPHACQLATLAIGIAIVRRRGPAGTLEGASE